MKKILLLSDTHGYIDDRIIHYALEADEVWHAGDIGDIRIADELKEIKPFIAVYGNIDNAEIRKEYHRDERFMCEDVNVLITHIGGYPGKYSPAIKDEIIKDPPQLFICGHSHILKVMNDKKLNLLHMNPGAAGISGFHKMRTMLRFKIEGKNIFDLEVIELGEKQKKIK